VKVIPSHKTLLGVGGQPTVTAKIVGTTDNPNEKQMFLYLQTKQIDSDLFHYLALDLINT